MDVWKSRDTIPENGMEVVVQSVAGDKPDDSDVIFEGKASYRIFTTKQEVHPLTGNAFGGVSGLRWVRSDIGKCVPGRIVRWKEAP